jgi:arginine repressor
MSKAQRQHRVVRILAEHPVSSQMELVDLLSEAGIDATQATASRDLGDLGAVKVRVPGGGSVYAVGSTYIHGRVWPGRTGTCRMRYTRLRSAGSPVMVRRAAQCPP